MDERALLNNAGYMNDRHDNPLIGKAVQLVTEDNSISFEMLYEETIHTYYVYIVEEVVYHHDEYWAVLKPNHIINNVPTRWINAHKFKDRKGIQIELEYLMLFEEGNNKSFTHLLQKPED
jgi:hypothetical protein